MIKLITEKSSFSDEFADTSKFVVNITDFVYQGYTLEEIGLSYYMTDDEKMLWIIYTKRYFSQEYPNARLTGTTEFLARSMEILNNEYRQTWEEGGKINF